uniref:Uncharacterized protein n=1 Tax=Molossus molossus TaxID=27622 RepID=A0A7J8C8Z2_MOLMO|nr:hypothetical protein HJG59_009948 [Molossus molossus]
MDLYSHTFCDLGSLLFRNTFGGSELEERLVSTRSLLPTWYPFPSCCWLTGAATDNKPCVLLQASSPETVEGLPHHHHHPGDHWLSQGAETTASWPHLKMFRSLQDLPFPALLLTLLCFLLRKLS